MIFTENLICYYGAHLFETITTNLSYNYLEVIDRTLLVGRMRHSIRGNECSAKYLMMDTFPDTILMAISGPRWHAGSRLLSNMPDMVSICLWLFSLRKFIQVLHNRQWDIVVVQINFCQPKIGHTGNCNVSPSEAMLWNCWQLTPNRMIYFIWVLHWIKV